MPNMEITAWMQMLALNGHQARRWESRRLRLRLFTLPATIARTGRQVRLHLATKAPWPTSSTKASGSSEPWPSPGKNQSTRPTTTPRPRPHRTGAHPRRHSGHCHTPMTKSTPADDLQPQQRSTPE